MSITSRVPRGLLNSRFGLGPGSFGRGAEQLQSISMKRWACDGWILLNYVLIGYRRYKPLQ